MDAEELVRLLISNRAFVTPFAPDRPDDFVTLDLQRSRSESNEHLYGILDDGALAGSVALSNVIRGPFQSATLGYWVDEARNGRGLATHAVGAIVDVAFTSLGLHRLEAAALADNLASQRVLEKNNFARIGIAPRYLHIAGAWRDHVLFRRTVED